MNFILFEIVCINHNIHLNLTKNANKLFIISFINNSLNKTLKCTTYDKKNLMIESSMNDSIQ